MDNKKLLQEELSVMEAVDHLSSMAELDLKSAAAQEGLEERINWLDPEKVDQNRQVAKESFRTIHNYLRHIYEREKGQIKDLETQKGIQSIMVLAGEAAHKLDKYTSLFQGTSRKGSVTDTREWRELQQFYITKIQKKFDEALESEDLWQEEWGKGEEDLLDIQRRGLKDLETVRRDKEYELFYIRKEDGKPFFNRNLIRHIRLVGDFDEVISDPTGEDPFLKIQQIQDREAHLRAREILKRATPYMDRFYKEVFRFKEMPLVSSLNQTLMALMLASNPRNLIQNTAGKSSFVYFRDFHLFLRQSAALPDYLNLVAQSSEDLDPIAHILLNLTHILASSLFLSMGARGEASAFINHLVERGHPAIRPAVSEMPISLWTELLEKDEEIRSLLKHYPNGPLLKTLDAFREGDEDQGFDPLFHENLATQMYHFIVQNRHITCLRMPSPTHQKIINKADIVEEFGCFLRGVKTLMQNQRHLLIDLQDRTSWQEYARTKVLEEFQKRAEFSDNLVVVTIPKNSEFYLQSATYQDLNEAEQFIEQFYEQITSVEECGFYFPPQIKREELFSFSKRALKLVHELFFSKKNMLTRKNRLDFIEIFYQLFLVKIIEMVQPDSISFTCKDSIDVGAAASSGFYAFLRILSDPSPWTKEEKGFFLWMLNSGSLIARERAIDLQRFSRMVSALSNIHAELETARSKAISQINKLYAEPVLEKIQIKESI